MKGLDIPMEQYIPSREIMFFEDELPEIKSWKVGDSYILRIHVEQVATEQRKGNKKEARFKVIGVEASKDSKHKETSEQKGQYHSRIPKK